MRDDGGLHNPLAALARPHFLGGKKGTSDSMTILGSNIGEFNGFQHNTSITTPGYKHIYDLLIVKRHLVQHLLKWCIE